jgi:hypothetical protein
MSLDKWQARVEQQKSTAQRSQEKGQQKTPPKTDTPIKGGLGQEVPPQLHWQGAPRHDPSDHSRAGSTRGPASSTVLQASYPHAMALLVSQGLVLVCRFAGQGAAPARALNISSWTPTTRSRTSWRLSSSYWSHHLSQQADQGYCWKETYVYWRAQMQQAEDRLQGRVLDRNQAVQVYSPKVPVTPSP